MRIMKSPKSVDIDITGRCNLRCTYCSHFASAGDVNVDLPAGEWIMFFEELGREAVMEVTLAGGEPFIRKDLKELLEGIVKNRMRFAILSNGTLITDEIASYIASTRRCNSVQVSIDGSGPSTHDACRGDGNFLLAVKGIKTLQKHGIPVAVRATIHKHNVHDLDGIARLLLEDIGIPSFSTNAASYFGQCRENNDHLRLTTAERSYAMDVLTKLSRAYNGRVTASAGPLAEAQSWEKMEKARIDEKESLPGKGYLRSCGGVFSKMAVRSDGVMTPCTQMSHIELGRVNKVSLNRVWQEHPELMRLRKRREIPLRTFAFCQACEYTPYCAGNCPALAYTITGKEEHPSPDACLRTFLLDGGKLPMEEQGA
jgi:SynChlorMet cassette radical SAM/SPASM protein ScmE